MPAASHRHFSIRKMYLAYRIQFFVFDEIEMRYQQFYRTRCFPNLNRIEKCAGARGCLAHQALQ
jgi:hypothetical protein